MLVNEYEISGIHKKFLCKIFHEGIDKSVSLNFDACRGCILYNNRDALVFCPHCAECGNWDLSTRNSHQILCGSYTYNNNLFIKTIEVKSYNKPLYSLVLMWKWYYNLYKGSRWWEKLYLCLSSVYLLLVGMCSLSQFAHYLFQ